MLAYHFLIRLPYLLPALLDGGRGEGKGEGEGFLLLVFSASDCIDARSAFRKAASSSGKRSIISLESSGRLSLASLKLLESITGA